MNRYRKRYIIPAVTLLIATLLMIAYKGRLFPAEIFKHPEMVAERLERVLVQLLPALAGVVLVLIYAFVLNHRTVGKVLFFCGMGALIIYELYRNLYLSISAVARQPEILEHGAEVYFEIWIFAILFVLAYIFLIVNRAKPHLVMLIIAVSLLVCLVNARIAYDFDIIKFMLRGRFHLSYHLEYALKYLYHFMWVGSFAMLALFDFQSRVRPALTVEEQLIRLKEKYECNEIDAVVYEQERAKLLKSL